MPKGDFEPDAWSEREDGGSGRRGFGGKPWDGVSMKGGEQWTPGACRMRNRRPPAWLLKMKPWNFHPNAQALAENLLPVPDSEGFLSPHNLSKEASRRD